MENNKEIDNKKENIKEEKTQFNKKLLIICGAFVILLIIVSIVFAYKSNRDKIDYIDNSISNEVKNYNELNIENIFNNYGKELYDENITFSQYGQAIRNEFLKHYFLTGKFWTYNEIKNKLPQTNYSCHYVSTSVKDTNEGEIVCFGGVTDKNGFTEYSVNLYFNEALYDYFKDNIKNDRQYSEKELSTLGFKELKLIDSDVDISVIEDYWDLSLMGYYLGKDGYLYDYVCQLNDNICSSEKVSESKLKSIMQLDCTGNSTVTCLKHSIFIFENGNNMYDNLRKIILTKNDLENLRGS